MNTVPVKDVCWQAEIKGSTVGSREEQRGKPASEQPPPGVFSFDIALQHLSIDHTRFFEAS